jgi:hypothetical protein
LDTDSYECFVCALVAVWYVLPALTKLSRNSALTPLLFVHVFRYVGMTLLVTDMIDPKLPREFLSSAAYGDLLAAVLALASIFALRSNWRAALPPVWVANTWGFADMFRWIREKGFKANIAEVRQEYPQLLTFAGWLKKYSDEH